MAVFAVAVNGQNNSINFDGVDDFISLGDSGDYVSAASLTVEAWINADVWKPAVWQGTVLGKDNGNTSGFVFRSGNNGSIDLAVGTPSGWISTATPPLMQAGVWNHVAGVIDVENGELRIYVNGVLEATTPTGPISLNEDLIRIGESSGFPGRAFDGRIDEVRIWDVVRTETQILEAMTVDLDASTPNLLAYYKLDELSGGNLTPNHITDLDDGSLQNFTGSPVGEGYAISEDDIAVEYVAAPDVLTIFANDSKVKASFINQGSVAISSFEASYSIDGGSSFVTETVTETINPGDSYVHTFEESLQMAVSSFDLIVMGELTDDQNVSNNSATVAYAVPATSGALEIPIFTSRQHNFANAGQTNFANVILPDSNLDYSTITLEVSVSCPSTGCDPWDQPANMSVVRNGQVTEIARYITPFGIGCGPWTVDVTDFKSLLRGNTNFRSFIQVWGPSGWILEAKLIYEIDPDQENRYQKITPLWENNYLIYGDPNISHDLEEKTIVTNPNSQDVSMRMTITGHGQGNTNNAAEFSPFTHQINANGAVVDSHFLWNPECPQNPCSPQLGSWTFPRAGWCPGTSVEPYYVDLTSNVVNDNITVDYVLADYTNLLNTDYNNNGHTEPHYRIHAFLVEKSDQYISDESFTDLAARTIVSPTNENYGENPPIQVMLENQGSTAIVNPEILLKIDGELVATEILTQTIEPGNSIDYTFLYTSTFDGDQNYNLSVEINADEDEAVSNDILLKVLEQNLSVDTNGQDDFVLFPNPSTSTFSIAGDLLQGETNVKIFSVTGALLFDTDFESDGRINVNATLSTGIYFVRLNVGDKISVKKLIIQ